MIIDAHVHIGSFAVRYPFAESKLERVVGMLKKEGVDYALISSARSLFYECTGGNQEALDAARKYPQLIPLLVVNPWHLKESLSELADWRKNGFVGVKLHPNCHQYCIGSAVVEPVLEICASEQIPVLTHSSGGDSLSGAGALEAAVKKYPKLKLVVGHGGIFSDRAVAQLAQDYPQIYLEISVEYEAGKLERTVEMIGADRILFGSDCPLHHPSVMLARVRVMSLPKADEEKILWKTAQRVFALTVK